MRLTRKGHERLIRGYLEDLQESVEIYYEPKNSGQEWYVGLANTHGEDLALHDHFPRLLDGLSWLVDAKRKLERQKQEKVSVSDN